MVAIFVEPVLVSFYQFGAAIGSGSQFFIKHLVADFLCLAHFCRGSCEPRFQIPDAAQDTGLGVKGMAIDETYAAGNHEKRAQLSSTV